MSLSTALSLLALLVSVFAALAVGAVYARLRLLEQTALNARSTLFADQVQTVPVALRPREGERNTVVVQLNNGCPTCHDVWQAVAGYAAARKPGGTRLVGLFATDEAAGSFPESQAVERVVDADQWAALSEGYTPCVFRIDATGRVTDRRFVYRDTDLPALLAVFAPAPESAPEPSGSSRAL
jgi:hypothetical protein